MKNALLLLSVLLTSLSVLAQEKISIYGDAGGASPLLSVNIDKRLTKSNAGIGFRAGLGLIVAEKRVLGQYPDTESNGKLKFTIPVAVNYLIGDPNQSSFLELALQGTYIPKGTPVDLWSSLEMEEERIVNRFMLSAFIGYRRNPVVKGIVFRIGYNPGVLDKEFFSWFGASLGWKFK